MITEAQLTEIDARMDREREVFTSLVAGGFDPEAVRHAMGYCPGVGCRICRHAAEHVCTGCPDC